MLTAVQAKFDAEVKRRFENVWYTLEQEINQAVCLGKTCLAFSHQGLYNQETRQQLVDKLSAEPYSYQVYTGNSNIAHIYWDEQEG